MIRFPPRRLLLLSVLLIAVGVLLLLVQQLGTFDTRQCAPDDPQLCWYNPDPWPGFIGTAFAVGGLALLTAGFAGERRKKGPPEASKVTSAAPGSEAPSSPHEEANGRGSTSTEVPR